MSAIIAACLSSSASNVVFSNDGLATAGGSLSRRRPSPSLTRGMLSDALALVLGPPRIPLRCEYVAVIVGVPLRRDIALPGLGLGLGLGGPVLSDSDSVLPSEAGAGITMVGRRRPCDEDAKSGTAIASGTVF